MPAITTAPPPTKSPSSMPNRNDRPALCSTAAMPSRWATWPISCADDAGELVRALGFVDQALEDVDAPARQRDRIGIAAAQHRGPQRDAASAAAASSWRISLSNAARPASSPARPPHSKSAPSWPASSELADLRVDQLAQPALDRIGHERRQAGRRSPARPRPRRGPATAAAANVHSDDLPARPPLGCGRCGRPAPSSSSIAAANVGSRTSSRASTGLPDLPSRSTPSGADRVSSSS